MGGAYNIRAYHSEHFGRQQKPSRVLSESEYNRIKAAFEPIRANQNFVNDDTREKLWFWIPLAAIGLVVAMYVFIIYAKSQVPEEQKWEQSE